MRGVNDLVLEYRNNSNGSSLDDGNDILINYMTWRLISEFYPNQPIDEAERKSKCLKDTEDMFAPAVTAMFVESKGILISILKSTYLLFFRTNTPIQYHIKTRYVTSILQERIDPNNWFKRLMKW